MKKTLLAVLFVSAILSPAAQAFDLGGLASKVGAVAGAVQGTPSELMDEQAVLVASYTKASVKVLEAQQIFANALNLKKDSESLSKVISSLQSGNLSTSDIDAVKAQSASMNDKVVSVLKEKQKLTDAQKKELTNGALVYAEGAVYSAATVAAAKKFGTSAADAMKSADVAGKALIAKDVAAGVALSTKFPGQVVELVKGGKQMFELMQSNGIDTKAAVTKLNDAAQFKL